ncbi:MULTISPECIES: hypothetical protein [unclassified Caulobacter]|uniref:hypothetical protein n=1 Tax=unclassified Caulobacter TaxID=2648921 RepID=UPI000D3C5A11|nr:MULTISPECIES: hypothetical protein [unclassified Caulobacter]PTS89401.1 hypothetical protein DBR21_06590 [Caulobacter sp. HMWF009]PTT04477.1 hypothetical protein DBR10_18635 [Caulobacter sp. HMWF025]
MEDLFRSYWWLIFPLSWFVFGGFQSWLSYRANRDTLDLLKSYAASGREPPPELVARLNKRWNEEDEDSSGRVPRRYRRRYREEHPVYRAVLFGALCAGFTYAAVTDLYGAGEAFTIVAFVMGALGLASLVSLLVGRGPKI